MKINMERGRLVIELPAESAELLVNGSKQAEYFLGVPEGPEDFTERLRKSNAALAACSMMRGLLPRIEKLDTVGAKDFAAGLVAGLRGEFRRLYPKDSGVGNAVQAPDCGKFRELPFRRGWELGSAIMAAATMAETGEDPRATW